MSNNELTTKIHDLRELLSLIDEAQKEAEAIKDAIKAHMGDTEELRAGQYKVTYKAVTSTRLDTAALKAALPDIAKRFSKATTTRRFIVA